MSTGDINYDRINDYGAVLISLASPHDIRSWSFGEVKKPETINYRTYRPEKDGLFCERIFGLEKIIYFQDYVVVEAGDTELKERQLLTEEDYRKAREKYGDAFEADMGAEAVKKLLEKLNLVDLSVQLRSELENEGKKTKPSKQ